MIKIGQYIPFHLSVFLSIGIVLGYHIDVPISIQIGLIIFSLLLIVFLFKTKIQTQKLIFQLSSYLLIFVLGTLLIALQNPKNQTHHFVHFYKSGQFISIQIVEKLKPTSYQNKYIAETLSVDSLNANGKILLNISRDSIEDKIEVGDVFLTQLEFSKIPKPLNPHTFDYADYMQKQGVFYQANLTLSELKQLNIENKNLSVWALKIRAKIQQKISKYPFGKNEYGIINALLLGDKQFISKDLQGKYAAAGAVHILAVSGLHVGILFLLLGFILKPSEKLKHGKIIKGILLIFILWVFALIAGMSGSVVRAVTMFSFITIGMLFIKKRISILYALFTSFFILLLVYPLYIFDVGFQLSYLAVLGIVLIQPKIVALIPEIKWILLRKVWQLTCVSIAATIATLPLSLYYFHQFPGLFVISNLIIVPIMGIILGIGLLVIGLALLNALPNLIIIVYNSILNWMNLFIEWIAHQEKFLFREIPFSFGLMLMSYLMIGLGFRWILDKKLSKFYTFLIGILLFQSLFIYEKWELKNSNEMVIFHKSKETVIGYKKASQLQILYSIDSLNPNRYTFLRNYKMYNKIDSIQFNKLEYNVLPLNKISILLVDSLGIYQNISLHPEVILMTQSSKINLERLIEIHKPKKIIADGSNYPYQIDKWKKTCEKVKIPFYYTGSNGALIIKIEN